MYKVELIEGTDSEFDKKVELTLNKLVTDGYELVDIKFSSELHQKMDLTRYSALIIVKDIRTERR
nr:MAG TPA: Sporulation protein Cse60 [Caudoviricetes sp.]